MKTVLIRHFLVILSFCMILTIGFAQKPILLEGDLDFLKGQEKLNVEYDYDNMETMIIGVIFKPGKEGAEIKWIKNK